MDNTRTTSSRARANRRAQSLRCRGRVRPRRPVLSKVVDVVSNSNDALGTTVGSKSNGKYSPAVLSAFGENLAASEPRATNHEPRTFFTGKPMVEGLGHAFWMRNYRAGLAKWQSADPMGYPDGWNQLAYCNNGVTSEVDFGGHARYAATEVVNKLKSALDKLENDWRNSGSYAWMTDAKVRAVCDSVFSECEADWANAANAPTISWFESSKDWVKVKDGTIDHVWEWQRKE